MTDSFSFYGLPFNALLNLSFVALLDHSFVVSLSFSCKDLSDLTDDSSTRFLSCERVDALLGAPLLEWAGFCFLFSSLACRFLGSFEDALVLPLLLGRRSWPVAFPPDDGSAVSRLRPPLLDDCVRGLVGLLSLGRTSSSGLSSISDGRFLLPLLLERPL